MGSFFVHLRLFFRKFSFIINTRFPPLLEMLYARRQKLYTEESQRYTHAVWAGRRPQNGALGVHLSGRQKDLSRGALNRDYREDKD